jgi:hypothetical protein
VAGLPYVFMESWKPKQSFYRGTVVTFTNLVHHRFKTLSLVFQSLKGLILTTASGLDR